MAKDPIQELVDSITLIRDDVRRLQRTSLDKDEAKALNGHVAKALAQMKAVATEMSTMGSEAPRTVRNAIQHDLLTIERATGQVAARAAREAIEGIQTTLTAERSHFRHASGEARREAWRYFGGFWVWLVAMLATGALLGALAAFWIGGTITAHEFGNYTRIFCGAAGGQVIEQNDGTSYCAVWINREPTAETGQGE